MQCSQLYVELGEPSVLQGCCFQKYLMGTTEILGDVSRDSGEGEIWGLHCIICSSTAAKADWRGILLSVFFNLMIFPHQV